MQFFDKLSICFDTKQHMGGCGWKELGPIVNELLSNILMLGIFIAILMIMYAGYVLVQGQGSPAARTQARNIFINIVIGMILLVGSYYIVEFILDTLNVNDAYRQDSIIRRN